MANTLWNTSDKTAGVTISGGGSLTATASGSANGVRAVDKQITGQFYWETTLTTANSSYGVGAALGSAALSTLYNTPTGAVIVYASGAIWVNNLTTGTSLGSLAAGGVVVCHALDLTNKLYWARSGAAGNWNNNAAANPATGVGGISIAAIQGGPFPLYPAAVFGAATATTANFGDTGFTGTPPSGFTSGFTSGATPPLTQVVTQIGAEVWTTGTPAMQMTQIGVEAWLSVAVASSVDYPDTVAETITLADTPTALTALHDSVAEVVTLVDTTAASQGLPDTVSEAIALVDVTTALGNLNDTVDETITLADLVIVSWADNDTVAESISLTDTTIAGQGQAASVSESISLLDTVTAQHGVAVSIAETMPLVDTESAGNRFTDDISETMTLSDSTDGIWRPRPIFFRGTFR